MVKHLFILLTAVIFLSACSLPKTNEQSSTNLTENNLPLAMVKMSVQLDKTTYRSYDKVNLSINAISDRDLENVLIEAKGINTNFNRSYFNQRQIINFKKQSPQSFQLSQTLPACNSCSGLIPGDYDIKISATYQGKILETETINLSISQ